MADSETRIAIVAKHNPLAFLLYMTKFVIELDGVEQPGPWGERLFPVVPGEHQARMWFRYLGRSGTAEVNVTAKAGTTTFITYKAPIFVRSSGKVSVQP
jgi:hypothetical protein